MSLRVIPDACEFAQDQSRGVVVIESTYSGPPFNQAIDELESTAAKTLAQSHAAANGVAPARINGNSSGIYPVNMEGLSLEHVKGPKGESLPPQHPRMQPKAYRIDIPVCTPIR